MIEKETISDLVGEAMDLMTCDMVLMDDALANDYLKVNDPTRCRILAYRSILGEAFARLEALCDMME